MGEAEMELPKKDDAGMEHMQGVGLHHHEGHQITHQHGGSMEHHMRGGEKHVYHHGGELHIHHSDGSTTIHSAPDEQPADKAPDMSPEAKPSVGEMKKPHKVGSSKGIKSMADLQAYAKKAK